MMITSVLSAMTIAMAIGLLPFAMAFLYQQPHHPLQQPLRIIMIGIPSSFPSFHSQYHHQHLHQQLPRSRSPFPFSRLERLALAAVGQEIKKGETILWNNATVLSTQSACPSGKSLLWSLQLTTKIGYTTPGQFLKLRWNATTEPLFLAMCSPPPPNDVDNGKMEFLVKTTPNIPWLTEIQEGATVQVSNVMGNGFKAAAVDALFHNNTDENDDALVDVDHVLLVAMGSGMAPLMALLRYYSKKDQWKDQKVTYTTYYGEWTMDDICFQEEFMGSDDMQLVPCLSKQKGANQGHVQTVLEQRGLRQAEKTLALVCGSTEMMDEVRQVLLQAGVQPKRIVTNV